MVAASLVLLRFLAYSFLGWVLEGAVRCLLERRLVNPGLLTGPFVPIYGVGALSILIFTEGARGDLVLIFVVGGLVATVVEYLGHVLLQRLLGLVLWDYSTRFGNFQGRVCLGNSITFGLASLAVVCVIDPTLTDILDATAPLLAVALASALAAIVAIDWTRSVATVVRTRPRSGPSTLAGRSSLPGEDCPESAQLARPDPAPEGTLREGVDGSGPTRRVDDCCGGTPSVTNRPSSAQSSTETTPSRGQVASP